MLRSLALLLLVSFFTYSRLAAAQGTTREVRLSEGPHAPTGAPDVVVHIPDGYDNGRPLELVIFLHGFDCCARALVASAPIACRTGEAPTSRTWSLGEVLERARTNAILVVPQLAYRARTSQNHRFTKHGAFERMLRELLEQSLSDVVGKRTLNDVSSITLVAHSGGYGALVSILRDPKRTLAIQHVVMLDALYAGWDALADWYEREPNARLVSLHTSQRQTVQGNEKLLALLRVHKPARDLTPSLAASVRTHRLVIARVKTAHGLMPQAHLADVLEGLLGVP